MLIFINQHIITQIAAPLIGLCNFISIVNLLRSMLLGILGINCLILKFHATLSCENCVYPSSHLYNFKFFTVYALNIHERELGTSFSVQQRYVKYIRGFFSKVLLAILKYIYHNPGREVCCNVSSY